MEKEKCVEKLKSAGYKAEILQGGIIYCYECDDFQALREYMGSIGYDRSFGATPRKKSDT